MAVVTDSTAALPPEVARAAGVRVVPLRVVVDGEEHREGDLGGDTLGQALARRARVSTSQPPPSAFAAEYEALAAAGAVAVVSGHLSAQLSGTVGSARTAATVSPVPVHVVDSGTVGLGLGFAALAAARAASGQVPAALPPWARWWPPRARRVAPVVLVDADAVADAARTCADGAAVWFLVDSLEHLRRGGRLSAPAAALGTVLGLRPLLTVRDGRVVVAEKIRTRRAARDRLEQVALDDAAGRGRVRVGVHHVGPAGPAEELAAHLEAGLGPRAAQVLVSDAGAVLAAHAGPGTLAVVVADAGPADDPAAHG